MNRVRRLGVVLVAGAGLALLSPAAPAGAHPLGNFTVNQHAAVLVGPGQVDVELVVDMAEIPAFQSRGEIDTDGDQQVSGGEGARYRSRTCASMLDGLSVDLDGGPIALRVRESSSLPAGGGGAAHAASQMPADAPLPGDLEGRSLQVTSDNYSGRAGWREMTARGRGIRSAATDVPAGSSTRTLRSYPGGPAVVTARRPPRRSHAGAPGP